MPVELRWLIPKHVLYAHYSGVVTPADIRKQYDEGIALCKTTPETLVHMVFDMREVTDFPKNLRAYSGAYGEKAANAGWVVMLGLHPALRFLSDILAGIAKLNFTHAPSVEAALKFIKDREAGITDEQVRAAVQELSGAPQS